MDPDFLYLSDIANRVAFAAILIPFIIRLEHSIFLRFWLLSILMAGVSSAALIFRHESNEIDFYVDTLVYSCYIFSSYFCLLGIRYFNNKLGFCKLYLTTTILLSASFFVLAYYDLPTKTLLTFAMATMSLLLLAIVYDAMTLTSPKILSKYIIAFTFLMIALSLSYRAIGINAGWIATELSIVSPGRILANNMTSLLLYVGLVLMTCEKTLYKLQRLSFRDSLTGLYNRRGLTKKVAKNLRRMKKNNESGCCVILADIDHFKAINDRYGHATGDEVLENISYRFEKSMRSGDIAVRWGGEEFLVLLSRTTIQEARLISERLRISIERQSIETGSGPLQVTVSMGVAVLLQCETDLDEAIKRADNALYYAKQAGRNQVHVYEKKTSTIRLLQLVK